MSNKSARKVKLPASTSVPRPLPQIEEDYGRLIAQAGQCQYNVFVYSEDLKRINDSLKNLNYEAAARKSLDQQAAAKQPEQQESSAPNEQA